MRLFMFITIVLWCMSCNAQELQGAWEKAKSIDVRSDKNVQGSASRYWFLGYVEGVIGVEPPGFWRDAVAAGKLDNQTEFSLDIDDYSWPYKIIEKKQCPKEIAFSLEANRVDLRVDGQSFQLVDPELVSAIGSSDCISAAYGQRDLIIVPHADRSIPFAVYCLDRETRKVRWRQVLHPRRPRVQLTGQGYHHIGIMTNEKFAIIFGVADDVVYLSLMDATNGKIKSAFSTAIP